MLCACGCGQETPIAKYTNNRLGWVKGQPKRFVLYHNGTRNKPTKEYRRVTVRGKLIRIHQLRAERALGKPLPKGCIVHHVDGTKGDDSPLVICQDGQYHQHLHVRIDIRKAGGDPWKEKICARCKRLKPFADFGPARPDKRARIFMGLDLYCHPCAAEYRREKTAREREKRCRAA